MLDERYFPQFDLIVISSSLSANDLITDVYQLVKMFSPDRQGFFPALWVQFVQELGEGERRQFAALTNRLKRMRTIVMTMQELQRMDVLPQKF